VALPESPLKKTGRQILLIDDEPLNQLLVHDYLIAYGYQVVVAPSAEEGMAMIGTLRPAMVLMDLTLPGMDGMEALRRIRSAPETADLPVVIVSGLVSEECMARCLRYGCKAYLTKPFQLEVLLELVRRWVDGGDGSED